MLLQFCCCFSFLLLNVLVKADVSQRDYTFIRTIDPTFTYTTLPVYARRTVCYDVVGCFDNNKPFDNLAGYLPISPDMLKTNFQLYTNSITADTLSYTDENSIKKSRYNKDYPLKIIIHGFQNTGYTPWVIDMTTKLFLGENAKLNVITVDWGLGAVFPLYFNASANTRLVGRQTCLLVKLIRKVFHQDKWSKDFNVHCIGHSLGAHTCAYASSECESAFDRISGLDPAGPFFESTDIKVRLDKTDAKFVDVIHSNGDDVVTLSFGTRLPCGHVDFYPNGGQQQPGCPNIGSLVSIAISNLGEALSSVSCSHGRAINYFIESITSPCIYSTFPCDNLVSFNNGLCLDCNVEACTHMGYRTPTNVQGVKYLITRSQEPFCTQYFLLEVTISTLEKRTVGELMFFIGEGSSSTNIAITKIDETIRTNSIYRKVLILEKLSLAEFVSVEFSKKPGADVNTLEVYIDKIKISAAENQKNAYSFCGPEIKLSNNERKRLFLKPNDCVIDLSKKKIIQKNVVNNSFKQFGDFKYMLVFAFIFHLTIF